MIYSSKSNENIQIIPRYKKKIKKLNNLKTARIYVALFLAILLIGFYYYFREHIVVRLDIPLKSNVKKENLKKYMMQELDHIGYIEPELQVTLDERIIHLDLKGAPPKISYFSRLFPLIAELGGTGILIEYEDMFPYNGTILKNVSALNAYSLKEITIINRLARENNLKVIPLIQTFGHLEFLLKLQQYKDYREVFAYPQVICPSHPHTMSLIEDMIDQIIASHPDIEMLHIGCDEVYYLGFCERCTNRMINDNVSKNLLFLEHVKAISQILNKKYPHIRILLWDDQFRSMTETDLAEVKLNENLEPVIWRYTKEVYDELGPSLWDMYSKIFRKVWIASAYKGAIGSNKYMSDVNHYLQNHRSWLSVVAEHKRRVNFRGIIMAGWQRYDHFAVLCELLPIGIPALAMSLRLLKGFKDSPLSPPTEVSKVLKCHQPYGLIGSAFGSPKCEFPGGDVLENVIRLQQLVQEYEALVDDARVKGWMNDYNLAHGFSNPQYVESVAIEKIKEELDLVKIDLTSSLSEVYDNYTVDEWTETYLNPFQKQVVGLWKAKQTLLSKESWPRRPLKSEL